MRHQAIYSTHPNVKYISQNIAYDLNNNVIDVDESLVQAKIAELEAAEPLRQLREQRNQLLAQSDWMAVSDRTMTQAQIDYRQALRDLPETADPQLDENGQLTNVTWPSL
jgi:shikimate kinase